MPPATCGTRHISSFPNDPKLRTLRLLPELCYSHFIHRAWCSAFWKHPRGGMSGTVLDLAGSEQGREGSRQAAERTRSGCPRSLTEKLTEEDVKPNDSEVLKSSLPPRTRRRPGGWTSLAGAATVHSEFQEAPCPRPAGIA